MKHLSKVLSSLVLAIVIAGTLPAQAFAESPDYISEIKIYEGSCKNAAKEGYTVLKDDDGDPVDLNEDSGSNDTGAKGDKAVYLGYKTTKKASEAITDLALMNMKGGYDVAEYDKLMDGQMSQQIVPFVEKFLAAINEYRENYDSADAKNRQRAEYIHDALNKMTDDDTGGAGLGDLFLNETVYEMAKPRYEALSDKEKEKKSFYDVNNQVRDSLPEAEKNSHADILTIIAQSNGKATLMLSNLLTRAADTSDDTWLERFEGTDYEDLLRIESGSPTDKMKKVAKKYDDAANSFLDLWEDFREDILKYDEYTEIIENYDSEAVQQAFDRAKDLPENASEQEVAEAAAAFTEAQGKMMEMVKAAEMVAICDHLENTDYGDGTMLDFFTQATEDVEDDATVLYPLIASLSPGQVAGLEFITIRELMIIALSEPEKYSDVNLDNVAETSIYEGVDRAIYQKGGVALTSEAFRADALKNAVSENEAASFSGWSIAMMALTGASFVAFAASAVTWRYLSVKASYFNDLLNGPHLTEAFFDELKAQGVQYKITVPAPEVGPNGVRNIFFDELYASRAAISKYVTIGIGVAMIALTAITIYLSYRDMKEHYDVDFTPIPHYMVDKRDLIGYNSNGEQIVLKNQSAYYKAVESNRKKGDSYYGDIGTCADMNGCVNPQWLALYAARNEASQPILADSLKVVVGSAGVPQGYTAGIHMFGEKAPFNLNSKLYCWNQKAPSIMVWYKTDKNAPTVTGSGFSSGTLALAAGCGAVGGAAVALLAAAATKKRKDSAPASA